MKLSGKRYRKDPNFVTRNIAGETILVPIKASTRELNSLYTLNEVATEAWERIDGRKSFGEIEEEILELFNVEKERAEKDLTKLFEALKEIGAIEEVTQ